MKNPKQKLQLQAKDIAEIKRLASQGLSPATISACLGVDYSDFQDTAHEDPRIPAAFKAGRCSGIDYASGQLVKAIKDKNVLAIKFFLQHVAEEFNPKPQMVIHNMGQQVISIDTESIEQDFAKSRMLLDSHRLVRD